VRFDDRIALAEKNLNSKVKKIIQNYITLELAVTYSWSGQVSRFSKPISEDLHEKEAFSELNYFVRLIDGLCQLNQKVALDRNAVVRAIREFLKRAPSRLQDQKKKLQIC
jgi:hypothetical protein